MSSSISKGLLSTRRPAPPPSLVGQLIADKYRLVRALGHGGMGSVYKAENLGIGKVVAIKLLHRYLADDPVAMQRFQREARTTVAIAHPNIVDVLDMGRDGTGSPYLVMEYVRGVNLKRLLRTAGPLSVERTARIAGHVASALAAAHGRGIIHRDLKPENILITARRSGSDLVKVVDFGISTFIDAKAEHERQVDLTPTGFTMATPFYASPEQIRGANGRDPRVDLYAVGVLLYEMLTSHRPFEGDNLPDLCMSILAGKITPLTAFRKDVPRAFEKLVRRALASGVQERFQNAQELLLALVPFGAERPRFEEPEPTDTFTADLRALESAASDAAEQGFPVQGMLVRALLAHFDERFGSARSDEILGAAKGAVRQVRTLAPCDSEVLARALTLLDARLGRGDRNELTAAGRHAARAFKGTQELPKSTTPELFFSLSSQLWLRHFGAGEARVSSVGRGYGKLELRGDVRRSIALVLVVLGLLEEGLRLAGGHTVSVRLTACSALGDASDVFEANWA